MASVAVLVGDGVNASMVQWPSHLRVEVFKHPKDVDSLCDKAKRGTFDMVLLHTQSTYPQARRKVKAAASGVCEIAEMSHSPAQMAKYLRSECPELDEKCSKEALMTLGRLMSEPEPRVSRVRVVEASKKPERRPTWSDDERTALLMAHESAFDPGKFIDEYLSLTADMDAPARSQAEIRHELDRIKNGGAAVSYDPWSLLVVCHAICVIESTAAEWKRRCGLLKVHLAATVFK